EVVHREPTECLRISEHAAALSAGTGFLAFPRRRARLPAPASQARAALAGRAGTRPDVTVTLRRPPWLRRSPHCCLHAARRPAGQRPAAVTSLPGLIRCSCVAVQRITSARVVAIAGRGGAAGGCQD